MHRTLNVESGIEKMFAMMNEMTWLRIEGDAVVVESETRVRTGERRDRRDQETGGEFKYHVRSYELERTHEVH